MKLKYKKSDGEIISVGNDPRWEPDATYDIVNVGGNIPEEIDYYIYNDGFVAKSQQDIDAIKVKKAKASKDKIKTKVNSKTKDVVQYLCDKLNISNEELDAI